jgi:hypothetical protein
MTPNQFGLAVQALDKVWPQIDGRTFSAAMSSAFARAASQNWLANDKGSYADQSALAVGTQLYVEAMRDRPGDVYSDRWGQALLQTQKILASKAGYKDQSADDVKNSAPASVKANIEIIAMVLGILAFIVVAVAVMYFLITNSADVVDNQLARNALERALVQAQGAAEKVIDQHLQNEKAAGHQIEWSAGELSYLSSLEQLQSQIIHELGLTLAPPAPSIWQTPWPYLGIGAASLVILGIVYKDDVKRMLARI